MMIILQFKILAYMKSYYFYITNEEKAGVDMTAYRLRIGSSKRDIRFRSKLETIAQAHGDFFEPRNQSTEDFFIKLALQLYCRDSLSITLFLSRNIVDVEPIELLRLLAHKRAYRADKRDIEELSKITLQIEIQNHHAEKIANL